MADGRISPADEREWGSVRVPPVSRRALSSAIQRQLDDGRDNISLSRDQATEVVLNLANCDDNEAKLGLVTTELQEHKYLAVLGDYAGRLFNCIRNAAPNKKDLPSSVSKPQRALTEEMSSNPFTGGKLREALDSAINVLSSRGLQVDFAMIQLAINVYNERNEAFHSVLRLRKKAS